MATIGEPQSYGLSVRNFSYSSKTRFDVTAAAGASRGFGIGGSGLTAVARASHSNCIFSILAYEDRLITITEVSYAGGKVNPWVSGSWFAIR